LELKGTPKGRIDVCSQEMRAAVSNVPTMRKYNARPNAMVPCGIGTAQRWKTEHRPFKQCL